MSFGLMEACASVLGSLFPVSSALSAVRNSGIGSVPLANREGCC